MSHTMKFLFLFVACFVLAAYADEIVIKVSNFKYDPQTVNAKKGDVLIFTWLSDGSRHDIVPSDSEGSCEESTTVTNLKTSVKSSGTYNYTITEDANTKIYYYCSVGNHCASGMYGTINVVSDTSSTATSGSPSGTSKAPSGTASASGSPSGSPSGSSTGTSTGTTSSSTPSPTNSAVSFNSITVVNLLVFLSSLIMATSLL
ncbi:hypothetical protein Glove_251g22 [Diversispora epigaea]|uniref:Blue (type 1) copper domain-containing protein n=1 Tax=Diversispora epigaea TaxID=1348612 RepID=A0A397IAL3_9GLOM|nr:hypothetical protein Glove_251g22 [Diversispora epigaea]